MCAGLAAASVVDVILFESFPHNYCCSAFLLPVQNRLGLYRVQAGQETGSSEPSSCHRKWIGQRLQVDVRQQSALHDEDDLREEPDHAYLEVPLCLKTTKYLIVVLSRSACKG